MFGGLLRREQREISADEVIALVNQRRLGGMKGFSKSVDEGTAMRHSAVWACVRLIAGVGSTLPIDAYRMVGSESVPTPAADVLVDPSVDVSPSVWRYQMWSSLLTAGNAYGLITEFTPSGFPRRVDMLNPAAVSWSDESGVWVCKIDGQQVDRWPNGRLWHTAIFVPGGQPFGLSPIKYAARSINAGLEAEKFGGEFFTGGGHPSSIIYSEQNLTAEQAAGAKDAFVRATAGREPAVFGAGLRHEQIQINPTDSQFLDSQRFTVEQIARIYGVFPEMIGAATSGSSVTYANREQRAADWLTYGLLPYLVPVEEALSSLLPRPQRVRANVSAVLRSDLSTRYQSYQTALAAGFLSVDEVRALEDLEPMVGTADGENDARSIAELIQKIYLGVGVVITADEARTIANRAGAGLEGSMPDAPSAARMPGAVPSPTEFP
jgi:HK97 family phage portal protein